MSHDYSETFALPPFYVKNMVAERIMQKLSAENIDLAMIIILTTYRFGVLQICQSTKLKPIPKVSHCMVHHC